MRQDIWCVHDSYYTLLLSVSYISSHTSRPSYFRHRFEILHDQHDGDEAIDDILPGAKDT